MKNLVKALSVLVVIVVSTFSVFAASNATDTSNNSGATVVGSVVLLIAAIVLPAFKGNKVVK
jgi:FtsH-binding integral membrane protein